MIKISEFEHLTASEQLEEVGRLLDVLKGRPRSNQKDVLTTYLKKLHQILDACRTRLRRARGLVRPRAAGLLIGIECSRVRDSACMYITSDVTTRIGVELAAVHGNYPIELW